MVWKHFPCYWPFVWWESTGQRWIPLTKVSKAAFDTCISFNVSLNKLLNKHSIFCLFETPWPSRDVIAMIGWGNGMMGAGHQAIAISNTVEPLWKGQESIAKVAKFGPFPCTILYKSCLFHPSWEATFLHSGETDEANCSWLHPVWPPPKRPDRDSTFRVESRASTELIFCIHRDFDGRNNVYKPCRLVCECCRDISAWKSRVMKPTVLRDPGRMKPIEYRDEANWFSNWTDGANCW